MTDFFRNSIESLKLTFNRILPLLFIVTLFCACESRKTIVNGLQEKEANEILVYLSTKGVEAQKIPVAGATTGGQKTTVYDISVKEEEANNAMSLLNQAGLPRRPGQNLLGIFANTGLVPSEMQDKIRYQAGLAEQIASTIRKIDGVLDAEVQISFPEEDPLNPQAANKQKITASVYIKHNGVLDDPNSHLLTKIKRLVAASVTGLDYDNVTVISDRARFSDLQSGALQGAFEGDKQFVNIWTIVLAKESVTRFRVIFFSLIVISLLLLLSLIWLAYKLYPILEKEGGVKELFHIHPLGQGDKKPEEKKAEEAVQKDKVKEGQDAIDSTVDKDVDET